MLAQHLIKASVSFWHSEHGSSAVVCRVFLLLEIACQFAGYIDDTVLFA